MIKKKSNNKYISCINCFNIGHTFKDCRYPITSYGIIGFKKIKGDPKIILVQRKDSVGFIDFIRGKYNPEFQKEGIFKILFGEMTTDEKKRIASKSFEELWWELWMNKNSRIFKNEYRFSKKKYESNPAKEIAEEIITESKWSGTEFGIPKGRRNNYEHPMDCALREFTEESGIDKKYVKLLNCIPIEEVFFGSNGIPYRHVYYLAEITTSIIPEINKTDVCQAGEVRYINWFNFKESYNIFRTYDSTKRTIIWLAFSIIYNHFRIHDLD